MDILFLLKPNFTDNYRDNNNKKYYCSECAFLEGLLSYYPELKEQIDIIYVSFKKPRNGIIEIVGEERQGCPSLIVDSDNLKYVIANQFHKFGNRLYTNNTKLIASFLRDKYGISEARF
jgi:hypothetical protein